MTMGHLVPMDEVGEEQTKLWSVVGPDDLNRK